MPLELDAQSDGRTTVVRVGGEVDLATAPDLLELLDTLTGSVVVDLSGVEFLDSSGLSALVATKHRLDANGGQLRLRRAQPRVQIVFEVSGLTTWFDAD
jgi:anti-sigma B factor antagonist